MARQKHIVLSFLITLPEHHDNRSIIEKVKPAVEFGVKKALVPLGGKVEQTTVEKA